MITNSVYYEDCIVIYFDMLGVGSGIEKEDDIYGNRETFVKLVPFYEEIAGVFNNQLSNDFKLFAFSDTALVAIQSTDLEKVASAAARAFKSLQDFSIPVRAYITRGNFGYHNMNGEESEVNKAGGLVSPIYGDTILNAHRMDDKGHFESCGIYIHETAKDLFRTTKNVTMKSGMNVNFLDLVHYLSTEDSSSLITSIRSIVDRVKGTKGEKYYQNLLAILENKCVSI